MRRWSHPRLWASLLTLAGASVVGIGIALFLFWGGFDAAADAGWSQPSRWLIHHTMIHSVQARAQGLRPPPFSPERFEAGFRIYDAHCAMCHGGPGLGRQPWTAGLEPPPPYLIDTSSWTSAEMFWVVSHGVKMTSMPAWSRRLSDDDIWNVVGFVKGLREVTPADYARLRALYAPAAPTTKPPRFPPVDRAQ